MFVASFLQPEEVVLCETLMRIFRTSIPCLPKSASNFAVELSKVLLPMIAKPSGRLSVSQRITVRSRCVMRDVNTTFVFVFPKDARRGGHVLLRCCDSLDPGVHKDSYHSQVLHPEDSIRDCQGRKVRKQGAQ